MFNLDKEALIDRIYNHSLKAIMVSAIDSAAQNLRDIKNSDLTPEFFCGFMLGSIAKENESISKSISVDILACMTPACSSDDCFGLYPEDLIRGIQTRIFISTARLIFCQCIECDFHTFVNTEFLDFYAEKEEEIKASIEALINQCQPRVCADCTDWDNCISYEDYEECMPYFPSSEDTFESYFQGD